MAITFRNLIANLANCILQNVQGVIAMLRGLCLGLPYAHPVLATDPALLSATGLLLRDATASGLPSGSTPWQAAFGRKAVQQVAQRLRQAIAWFGKLEQTQPTTGTVCRASGRAIGA